MTLIIHKEPYYTRLVTLGQADRVLAPNINEILGRVEMSEEKKLDKDTGVEIIHKEDADKQGPVGTGAEQPAHEAPSEDVKIGNKEEKENG